MVLFVVFGCVVVAVGKLRNDPSPQREDTGLTGGTTYIHTCTLGVQVINYGKSYIYSSSEIDSSIFDILSEMDYIAASGYSPTAVQQLTYLYLIFVGVSSQPCSLFICQCALTRLTAHDDDSNNNN